MNGQKPLEGPLEAKLTAVFQVPKSWSRKKRQAALLHQLRPIVKPDCDNIIKVLDGLNGICFKDDAQIVELSMKKVYGPEPYLEITIQDKVLHNDLKPEN